MKNRFFLVLFPLLISSCASVHPGNDAVTKLNNDKVTLKVSGKVDGDVNSSANTLVNLTFENMADRWVKIESIEVLIAPSEADRVSVVVGKDLHDWIEAYSAKQALEENNRAVLLSSLFIGGAIASAATRDSTSAGWKVVEAGGALTSAVAGTMMISDSIHKGLKPLETAPRKEGSNADVAFSVPGKLFVRKWILLNKPSDRVIDKFVMRVKTIEGESEVYEIPLR